MATLSCKRGTALTPRDILLDCWVCISRVRDQAYTVQKAPEVIFIIYFLIRNHCTRAVVADSWLVGQFLPTYIWPVHFKNVSWLHFKNYIQNLDFQNEKCEALERIDLHYKLPTTGKSQVVAAAFRWATGIPGHINPTQCYLPDSNGYLNTPSPLLIWSPQEDPDRKRVQA